MTGLSSVRSLQPSAKTGPSRQATTVNGVAGWLRWANERRDLVAVVGFCAIGLILTFAVLAGMPNFFATIGEISAIC